jgi:uncharacterized Ntn-hydrolase superfamily protein
MREDPNLRKRPPVTRRGTGARGRQGTYSIVARDPDTGELGVAVQSHWFSVGPLVPWARAGVGAVATQANVDVSYGPHALDLLAHGANAEQALSELLAKDPGAHGRQVAIIDAHGMVAAHTGQRCMAFAGHSTGEQVSCQANIMANRTVWDEMLSGFASASGPLAERLLAALDAGEAAGGDIRGRQSAAILIAPAEGEPWESMVSLRVDDHPEPLHELHRLLQLHDAYVIAGRGDALTNEARYDEAAELYKQACELAPDNHELIFWAGLGSVQSGDVDAGLKLVRQAIELQPGWAELLPRLTANVAPSASMVAQQLGLA